MAAARTSISRRTMLLLHRTISGNVRWNPRRKKIGFMSKNNDQAWKTKYGPRRVRHEAPTLADGIVAAQGLSDELDEQAEIAAALMGLPYDEVHAALLKTAPLRKDVKTSVVF